MQNKSTLAQPLPADHPIDTSVEFPYRLREIGEHLPSRPGYHAIWRYVRKGMRHKKDEDRRVKLQTVTIAGVKYTTIEAYHRMVAEANR